MATNIPTHTVQIAFDDGPLVASPTWTDVSSDVLEWSVTRGRSTELDAYQTGSATVKLANRTRKYDPLYSSGTYFGKLLPRKQIRIRATWNSVTYEVFRGFIASWPQDYTEAQGMATSTTLSCFDAFGVLAGIPLGTYYDLHVTSKTPVARWPLGVTGKIWPEVAGKYIGYLDGDMAAQGDAVEVAAGPSTYMDPSTHFGGFSKGITSGAGWLSLGQPTTFTVAGWFRYDTSTTAPTSGSLRIIYNEASGAGSGYYGARIGVDSTGSLHYYGADDTPGAIPEAKSSAIVNDGNWHHFAIVHVGSTSITVYIDGKDVSSVISLQQGNILLNVPLAIGFKTGTNPDYPWNGDLAEINIFDYAFTATEVSDLYNAGWAPLEGDSTSDQAQTTLDAAGWPSGLYAITADGADCGPAAWAGETAGSYLQKLADTEQGAYFVSAAGVVTWRTRYWSLQDTHGSAIQATFSDDGIDTKYADLATDYGTPSQIINDVTVTIPGGGTGQRYTDSTSVTAYGPTAITIDSVARSANAALNLAAFKVARYKDPMTRVAPFRVPIRDTSTMWPAVLSLELGYRINLEKTPQRGRGSAGVGTAIDTDLLVEQITHSWRPGVWDVSLGGSPGFISAAYWQLGTSQLGNSTTLGY